MIYPIVAYGYPVLRKRAEDIPNDGSVDVKTLSENMFETMYAAHGVGLAGPQIGLAKRIFVVDGAAMDPDLKDFKQVFINAELLEEEGEAWGFEEGCLSIPHIREEVFRQPKIKIRFFDENWKAHEKVYEGIAARIVQHEYDHIEGILFTDHVGGLRKQLLKTKLDKISKGKITVDYRMAFPKKK
ncbi:MAG: peptide deformylase [Bernardetiaceae bacterium]|nr:peptide deformylase [Bernardetiaceae bacterium]